MIINYIFEDCHKLHQINRRSTLIDNQLKNCFGCDIFTDEITNDYSEYYGELDEDEINTTPLTSSFKIIPIETDGNYLFYILNNIVLVDN